MIREEKVNNAPVDNKTKDASHSTAEEILETEKKEKNIFFQRTEFKSIK